MLGWAILAITASILHRRGHSWPKAIALAVGFYLLVPVALSLGLIGAIEAGEQAHHFTLGIASVAEQLSRNHTLPSRGQLNSVAQTKGVSGTTTSTGDESDGTYEPGAYSTQIANQAVNESQTVESTTDGYEPGDYAAAFASQPTPIPSEDDSDSGGYEPGSALYTGLDDSQLDREEKNATTNAPPLTAEASEVSTDFLDRYLGICDPAYPEERTCIPPGPPFNQGCAVTDERLFTVLPPDPQRLDADKDGIGCEPIGGAQSARSSSVLTPPLCDSSYPDFCIPPGPPDLDCIDIEYMVGPVSFTALQPDSHFFDGDGDGIGCEPYDGSDTASGPPIEYPWDDERELEGPDEMDEGRSLSEYDDFGWDTVDDEIVRGRP